MVRWSSVAAAVRDVRDAVPHPVQRRPRVIQFPVNDICNSRCQMCFIWENKRGKEVTPDEVRLIMSSPVFRDVESVGLNGGEPTLRKDLGDVALALAETLPNLRGLSVITNAWKNDLCISRLKDVAHVTADHGLDLDVMVSVDGVGDVHDRVRGRKGNFEAACRVLDYVGEDPRVTTSRIGCTVIRENVFGVEKLLEWVIERGIYARFRLGVPHQRLYNQSHLEPFALSEEERYHFAAFLDHLYFDYEPQPARRFFYRSLRDQLVYHAARRAGCAWKSSGATLLSNGDLAYCAVQSQPLGNALSENPQRLYWDNADYLSQINETKCANCAHDYEGYSDRTVALEQYARRAFDRLPPSLGSGLRWTRHWQKAGQTRARVSAAVAGLKGPVQEQSQVTQSVLLTGWYGTETAGDKAILGGIVNTIRSVAPTAEIDVASLEPYVTRETARQMPGLNVENVISLEQAKQTAGEGRYRMVAVAGGPMMSKVGQVVDLLEIQAAAKANGSRTAMLGCGIGPLGVPEHDDAIAWLARASDRIVLRDGDSAVRLKEDLGVPAAVVSQLDPAFVWLDDLLSGLTPEPREDKIVLALRNWPYQEYGFNHMSKAEGEALKNRFEAQLLAFVDHVSAVSPQTVIQPVCMHTLAMGGDDRVFYRRLFRDRPNISAAVDFRHRTPADVAIEFTTARAALTMRFHGLVFALGSKTPAVAIDYTLGGKIEGLLDDLGRSDMMRAMTEFDGREAAETLLSRTLTPPAVSEAIDRTRQALHEAVEACLGEGAVVE